MVYFAMDKSRTVTIKLLRFSRRTHCRSEAILKMYKLHVYLFLFTLKIIKFELQIMQSD